ncbi:MAG: hypothetical protein MUO70_03175, partial [Euryarchaeota archaeon]|nr:hypothetical protein [Euryarchaeota archaeon]
GSGIGFLPSLGYEHYGTLPRRTGGFLEIQLWGRSMADYRLLGDYESRLPQEFELEIELHDTLAAMATFEKNITVFSNRFKDVALIMTELRGAAMTYPFVSSREERPE